jgi:predicted nicotinamide N-methyase
VPDELVSQAVELPGGALRVLLPRESAELPDAGAVEWAPLVPYRSVLWRSGVALARELAAEDLSGKRVIELGCGLGLPSLAAARQGAAVTATDADPEALALVERNARENGLTLETLRFDWSGEPPGRFDLALAADVLYERTAVAPLLRLLPRLAEETWLADPGRPAADAFLERVRPAETSERGIVRIHRLR